MNVRSNIQRKHFGGNSSVDLLKASSLTFPLKLSPPTLSFLHYKSKEKDTLNQETSTTAMQTLSSSTPVSPSRILLTEKLSKPDLQNIEKQNKLDKCFQFVDANIFDIDDDENLSNHEFEVYEENQEIHSSVTKILDNIQDISIHDLSDISFIQNMRNAELHKSVWKGQNVMLKVTICSSFVYIY